MEVWLHSLRGGGGALVGKDKREGVRKEGEGRGGENDRRRSCICASGAILSGWKSCRQEEVNSQW